MKKTVLALAVIFLLAIGAFAQSKPDYSGEWTLDVSKSKLDERMRIESMTINATQTATDIKVDTQTKRTPNPNAGGGGGGGQGGGGGRGGFGGGGGPMTYTLDGKEVTIETDGPNGVKIPNKLQAAFGSDGSLTLNSSRTFSGPNGDVTTTTKDVWTLSDGGKTLTVKRESTSPRGTQNSEFVLTKK